MSSKQSKSNTIKLVLLGLVSTIALGIIVLVLFVIVSLPLGLIENNQKAAKIRRDFPQEVSTVPGLIVNQFNVNAWDGYSFASITIPHKGTIDMYYRGTGKFSLLRIGDYSLLNSCRQTTWLSHDSPYLKWFPEVNNLSDLVEKYDQIIASIEKLPTSPQENFRVYHQDTKISCDLVQQKITK